MTRRYPYVAAVLAAAFLTALMASTAGAADPAEVEDLIRRAVEFRRAGNDHQALPLLRKGYQLAPTPRTAAQLGLVEMALGYRIQAEVHLTEALASPHDIWVQKNRATLDQSLRNVRAAIGDLVIQGVPAGSSVLVNGELAGQLPLAAPVRVGEGPASVEVRAPGYAPVSRSITVIGGQRQNVSVTLHREQGLDTPTPSSPSAVATSALHRVPAAEPPPDSEESTKEQLPEPTPPPDDTGDNTALRPVAWVAAGLALAGIGFGIFETSKWKNRQDAFDGQTRPAGDGSGRLVPACGAEDPNRGTIAACGTIYDEMSQAKTLAIVGYAVGGGLAIGSAILFVVSRSRVAQSTSAVAFGCAPGGSLNGIVCGMLF